MNPSDGRGWMQMPKPPARGLGPVLAIGSRALITGREPGQRKVSLLDDNDSPTDVQLPVDSVVEVVAWKPRSQAGTRYLVRVVADGREGWLGSDSVRAPAPVPRPPRQAPLREPPPAKVRARRPAPATAKPEKPEPEKATPPKREETKREEATREAAKGEVSKRETPKRETAKRETPKRETAKRRTAKRATPKRGTPKRDGSKRATAKAKPTRKRSR
jgi:hypothetical protein